MENKYKYRIRVEQRPDETHKRYYIEKANIENDYLCLTEKPEGVELYWRNALTDHPHTKMCDSKGNTYYTDPDQCKIALQQEITGDEDYTEKIIEFNNSEEIGFIGIE